MIDLDTEGSVGELLPGLEPPPALDELVRARVGVVLRSREPTSAVDLEALPQQRVPTGERWVYAAGLAVYGSLALLGVWRVLARALSDA